MTTTAFSRLTILHLAVRDPRQLPPGAHSWRCAAGTCEQLIFKRSTLLGPAGPGHTEAEKSSLLDQAGRIRQEILRRALKNPVISNAADASLNVDWINRQEKELARLVQLIWEACPPNGEAFCFLIDRNGVANLGKHRMDFPTALYIDVINVESPEDLGLLNSGLWEWLGSAELGGPFFRTLAQLYTPIMLS